MIAALGVLCESMVREPRSVGVHIPTARSPGNGVDWTTERQGFKGQLVHPMGAALMSKQP